MSEIPEGLKYTTEHEYLRQSDEADVFYVGITDYAQASWATSCMWSCPNRVMRSLRWRRSGPSRR